MNYQKTQRLPKKIQTAIIKQMSERPEVMPGTSKNYVRQKYIDVVGLYKLNEKLAKRPPAQARMDEEDRLAYIRECK